MAELIPVRSKADPYLVLGWLPLSHEPIGWRVSYWLPCAIDSCSASIFLELHELDGMHGGRSLAFRFEDIDISYLRRIRGWIQNDPEGL